MAVEQTNKKQKQYWLSQNALPVFDLCFVGYYRNMAAKCVEVCARRSAFSGCKFMSQVPFLYFIQIELALFPF